MCNSCDKNGHYPVVSIDTIQLWTDWSRAPVRKELRRTVNYFTVKFPAAAGPQMTLLADCFAYVPYDTMKISNSF